MLNNKGFAVSSILYTLLIVFLLFLVATLSEFSSSIDLVSRANDDLINGKNLIVMQTMETNWCGDENKKWYTYSDELLRIKSKYGTMYWPRDFYNYDKATSLIGSEKQGKIKGGKYYSSYRNIGVVCSTDDNTDWNLCTGFSLSGKPTQQDVTNEVVINGVSFDYDTIEKISNGLSSIVSRLNNIHSSSKLLDSSNPFLSNDINNNEFCAANNLGSSISVYHNNEKIHNCRTDCNGTDGKRINYLIIENNESFECKASLETSTKFISDTNLIDAFESDTKKFKYPIMYSTNVSDSISYGFVPIDNNKVYLKTADKTIIRTTKEEIETAFKNSEKQKIIKNNSLKDGPYDLKVKVFDDITSGPDDSSTYNTYSLTISDVCAN